MKKSFRPGLSIVLGLVLLATILSAFISSSQGGFPTQYLTLISYTQTQGTFLPNFSFNLLNFIADYLFWFGVASLIMVVWLLVGRQSSNKVMERAYSNFKFLAIAALVSALILFAIYYLDLYHYGGGIPYFQFPSVFYYVSSNCTASYGCIGGSHPTTYFNFWGLFGDYVFWIGLFYLLYIPLLYTARQSHA